MTVRVGCIENASVHVRPSSASLRGWHAYLATPATSPILNPYVNPFLKQSWADCHPCLFMGLTWPYQM